MQSQTSVECYCDTISVHHYSTAVSLQKKAKKATRDRGRDNRNIRPLVSMAAHHEKRGGKVS
jgi:hypothetical protein